MGHIELSILATVCGGQQQPQQQPQGEPEQYRRTWGQVAREYGAACVQGAGQSLIFAGRPRNWRQGVTNAAMGCAMGVGMKAVDDASQLLTGQ